MSELMNVKNVEDIRSLLKQYELLINALHKINDVRESANNWWTGMNTALIGMISYFRNMEGLRTAQKHLFLWTILILGVLLC